MARAFSRDTVLQKSVPISAIVLIGSYVLCQAVADVAAVRPVQMFGLLFPSATFIYAATLTVRDLIHRRFGAKVAVATILWAGVLNIIQAIYLAGTARIASPEWFTQNEVWANLFCLVPSITAASILAEIVSELADTGVYSLWGRSVKRAPLWSYVVVSNAISLVIDSLLFCVLAFTVFSSAMSLDAALSLAKGQMLIKGAITILTAPLIYTLRLEQS